jgi:hypothetical protein
MDAPVTFRKHTRTDEDARYFAKAAGVDLDKEPDRLAEFRTVILKVQKIDAQNEKADPITEKDKKDYEPQLKDFLQAEQAKSVDTASLIAQNKRLIAKYGDKEEDEALKAALDETQDAKERKAAEEADKRDAAGHAAAAKAEAAKATEAAKQAAKSK